MEEKYWKNKDIDELFYDKALVLLNQLEDKYSKNDLKKIKISNLKQLVSELEDYRPKSHMKNAKIKVLKYLNHFIENPINKHSRFELLKLEKFYITSILNYRFDKLGYTAKGVWVLILLLSLPLDIVLWFFIGEYYYYIPIISILLCVPQFKKEIKAKAENKLW